MSRTSSARRSRASRPERTGRLALLLILAATAAVYLNSLRGEFVYDDRFQILRNPRLASWSELPRFLGESVWQFAAGGEGPVAGAYYRPLFNFSLLALWQMFGAKTFGWHLVSLALHLAATAILFGVARRAVAGSDGSDGTDGSTAGGAPPAAVAAALLFGLHPVHSEVVAWISALPDLLAAPLLLGALALYERDRSSANPVSPRRLAAAALFFLACSAKETAIVFPAFLVVRELFPCRDARSRWGEIGARLVPFAAAAAASLALRLSVMGFLAREDVRNAGVSSFQLMLSAPVLLVKYLGLLVAPWPLTVVYPFAPVSSPLEPRFLLSVALLAGLAWLFARHASRPARLGWVWALLFLLPVLNFRFFNPLESYLHDRYLYLPSLGFCVAAGAGFASLLERRRELALAAGAATAVALGVATILQNRQWRDDLALSRRTIAVRPEAVYFHNYLGTALNERGDAAGAETSLREALRRKPDYAEAAANLGNLYFQRGRLGEAEAAYQEAVGRVGIPADIALNLAVVRIRLGRMDGAAEAARLAVRTRPGWPEAHYTLAWIDQNQGRVRPAEAAYREALRLRPSYVEPRINLSELLRANGRAAEAVELLREGLRVVPRQPLFEQRLSALGSASTPPARGR